MSTIVQIGSDFVLTICGTPLYSSPELLKKKGYSYKVDIWAIGIMCYELLMGRTPFHSKKLVELLAIINKGDYAIALEEDPVSMECAMFLVNCMQADESHRVCYERIHHHPFLKLGLKVECEPLFDIKGERTVSMHPLDRQKWQRTMARLTGEVHRQSYDLIDYTKFDKDKILQNMFILNTQANGTLCIETLNKFYEQAVRFELK